MERVHAISRQLGPDSVALVVVGGDRIHNEVCLAVARHALRVCAVRRNADKLAQTFQAEGKFILQLPGDVAKFEEVDRIVDYVERIIDQLNSVL